MGDFASDLHAALGDRYAIETLALIPSDPHAHLELGLTLLEAGDTDGAAAHLSSALEIWADADPEYGPPAETRAALARLGLARP